MSVFENQITALLGRFRCVFIYKYLKKLDVICETSSNQSCSCSFQEDFFFNINVSNYYLENQYDF